MATIQIDLADLGLSDDGEPTGATIRDQVIARAATLIADRYEKQADRVISERIDAVIDRQIGDIVATALAQPIQRRSRWGEKTGEPTTVLEIAREKLQHYFDEPDRRDPYRSGREKPANLASLINDVVREALNAEFKPAVAEARGAVSEMLREALAAAVVKNVAGA